jgi:hypothetical protein
MMHLCLHDLRRQDTQMRGENTVMNNNAARIGFAIRSVCEVEKP